MPFIFLVLAMMGLLFSAAVADNFEETAIRENAEFEAKNCPHMLQVDSKYCKPIEDK